MTTILKVLGYLVLAIVLMLVAHWNRNQLVDVTWWPGRELLDVPVFVVILGSVFVGVLIAGLIGAVEHFRHRLRQREQQRRIAELEREVRELRNLPISEGLRAQDEADDSSWSQSE